MLFLAAGVGGSLLAAVKFEDEPVPGADIVMAVRSVGFEFPLHLRHADGRSVHDRRLDDRDAPRLFPRWLVVSGYVAALVLLLNVSYVQGSCSSSRHGWLPSASSS